MIYEDPPPNYHQGMDQPAVTIAGPTAYVPQPPNQYQNQYKYMEQSYPQQPIIIQQQSPSNRWFHSKGVTPLGGAPMKSIYNSQIVWAIINAIFFFPLLFLWIPALVFSLKSRDRFKMQDYVEAKKKANIAMLFNLICTILGKIFLFELLQLKSLLLLMIFSKGIIAWMIVIVTVPVLVIRGANDDSFEDCYKKWNYPYYVCEENHKGCSYMYGYNYHEREYEFFYKCFKD